MGKHGSKLLVSFGFTSDGIEGGTAVLQLQSVYNIKTKVNATFFRRSTENSFS